MKSKLSRKIKVIIIAGGVLLLGTAALVTGIAVTRKAEENKVVSTPYIEESAVEEIAQMQTEDTEPVTAGDYEHIMLSMVQEEMQHIDITNYVPQTLILDDLDSSNITAEQAMSLMVVYVDTLCDETIDVASLSATFYGSGSATKHDIWRVFNTEFDCGIDANIGEIIIMEDNRRYKGVDRFADNELKQLSDEITENPEEYLKKAKEIVVEHMAKGRNIKFILFGGVKFKRTEENDLYTYRTNCNVFMETGEHYGFTFTGSELFLTNFNSFPTQEGFYWEDEALVYADEIYIEESRENSPKIIISGYWGIEYISADLAVNKMMGYVQNLYGETIDASSITATFNGLRETRHKSWSVINTDFHCDLDAISGDVIWFDDMRAYEPDSENYLQQYTDNSKNFDEQVKTTASNIVEAIFANGHELDRVELDAIHGGGGGPDMVDCYVLMKSGKSYYLGLLLGDFRLKRFSSHPTQTACLQGYYWEDEA